MQVTLGNRRLAAIAAIDMVGFSRLVELDEVGTLARQKAIHKEVIEPLCMECGGRVVKTTGDGALMEFDSAVNAVKWAAEFQRKISEREAIGDDQFAIAYRVGINVGDIVVDQDDIFGEGVNVAARLEALAEPGGILISEGVFRNVRGKLELGFADMGEQSVKNISEPVRAFSVLLDTADFGKVVPFEQKRKVRAGRILAGALIGLIAGAVWLVYTSFLSVAPRQLAGLLVVPFQAETQSDQMLADAATENLLLSFERLKQVQTVTYSTAKTYEGIAVELEDAAQDLGVRFILDGSAKSENGQVELSVRLRDGSASGDAVVLQHTLRGEAAQLLDMLVTAKLKAAGAMKAKLSDVERSILEARPTRNPDAYLAFARASRLLDSKDFTDIAKALPLFEKAIALDPEFQAAKLASAEANFQIWEGSFNTIKFTLDALATSTELVDEVLAVDPDNPDAIALKVRKLVQQLQRDRALTLARGSVFKNPGNPTLRFVHGLSLTVTGRYEEALEEFLEYERLSPRLNSGEKGDLAWSYLRAGDSGQALQVLMSIPTDELREQHYRHLADAHFQEGNVEVAQSYMERFLKNNVWLNLMWMKPWFDIYEDPQVFSVFAEAMLGSGLPERAFGFEEGPKAQKIGHEELKLLHSDAFEEQHTVGPFGAPYSEERNPDGTISMHFGWMNGIPLEGTWQIAGDQMCRNIPAVHQGREMCHHLYLDPEKSTAKRRYVAAPWSFGVVASVFVRTAE